MDGAIHHVRRAGAVAIALLVATGLVSALVRAYIIFHPGTQFLARIQQSMYDSFTRDRTLIALWTREAAAFELRLAAHDRMMLIHVAAGGTFLLLALLQFSSRIRRRHLALHRWSGRILVTIAIASTIAGLFFGLVIPFGGLGEITATGFFGLLFIVALVRAVVAVRKGEVAVHREWMIRAYGIALGISTIRIAAAVLQRFTPAPMRDQIGLMFWLGWGLTLAAAEAWVRMTRVPTLQPVPRQERTSDAIAARTRLGIADSGGAASSSGDPTRIRAGRASRAASRGCVSPRSSIHRTNSRDVWPRARSRVSTSRCTRAGSRSRGSDRAADGACSRAFVRRALSARGAIHARARRVPADRDARDGATRGATTSS